MTGWERASDHAAGESYADWERVLLNNPKVLWGLIADVVKAVRASEGERKTGRRPAATVGSLDELYALLFPPIYMTHDFPTAMRTALGARHQKDLGDEVGMSPAEISRLINGIKKPSLREMELLARGLNVRPTYFREYRAGRIAELIGEALAEYPDLSADCVRTLVGARR